MKALFQNWAVLLDKKSFLLENFCSVCDSLIG